MPQYLDEAEWVGSVARQDRRVLGAVVCLPLERGGSIEPEMERVVKLPTVRGVRRLIQNQPDPEFVLRADFLDALRLCRTTACRSTSASSIRKCRKR